MKAKADDRGIVGCKTIPLLLLSKQMNARDLLLRRREVKLVRLMLCSRNFERRCKSSFRASAPASMLLNREDQVCTLWGGYCCCCLKTMTVLLLLLLMSGCLLKRMYLLEPGRGSGGRTDGQQHSLVPCTLTTESHLRTFKYIRSLHRKRGLRLCHIMSRILCTMY